MGRWQLKRPLERLAFLRGKWRLMLLWPALALVIGALAVKALMVSLAVDREQAEGHATREAHVLAQSYAAQLTRTLDAVDQTLLHVKYEWELSRSSLNLEQIKKKGLFPPYSFFDVAIADSAGRIATSTIAQARGTSIADRSYFKVQKNAYGDDMYIAEPVINRVTGEHVLSFSRKLTTPEGDFAGIVFVSAQPDYFVANFASTVLGPQGLIGVAGVDQTLLLIGSDDNVDPPGGPTLYSVPLFPNESGAYLLDGDEWFSDRRSRYVGWDTLVDYPLIAMIGLDQQDALAPYHARREALIRQAYWGGAALLAFTLIATGMAARLAWRKHQFETTQAAYRMATEGGNEGFYIARPRKNVRGSIVDFQIMDCNQRGAQLLGLRPEELIGKSVSSIYGGSDPSGVTGCMLRASREGVVEGEIHVAGDSPLRAKWVYLKAVRSGNDLAVTLRDISDTKAHLEELERRSNMDALTELPNRHWVHAYLPRAIESAAAAHTMLAILFIDLDGFKSVNDTMGHAAGDELLRIASRRLKVAVRPHDKVVRLGGDEFLVIIDRIAHKDDAAHVASRILHAFKEGFRLPEGIRPIGASIGISIYPADGANAQALLESADIAMYSVKTAGKGSFRFYEQEFYERLRSRVEQEYELRRGIEADEFVMYYQPRVEVATGRTCSMEALVRWNHPEKGLVEPLHFIPLAEETGLIRSLGSQVIDKVCTQLSSWGKQSRNLVPVSINVSPRQFNEEDIASVLADALSRHQVDPRLVEIELTESSMMDENREVSGALAAIQKMGVKLLVDDFGTGYSSLSQLQRLDFDVLKVDRAFTKDLERTERGRIFFTAIITMAHALGMRVVAEGVENETQLKILRTLQCDEVQGFYLSKPLPPCPVQPVLPPHAFAPAS